MNEKVTKCQDNSIPCPLSLLALPASPLLHPWYLPWPLAHPHARVSASGRDSSFGAGSERPGWSIPAW